ncbi:MAG: bifunctional 4-hydroxy-2-oxoglutarate aldolase/2-dehydro-3-deoxy-phosphogluconate aldolase [Pseudomonadota bacterium]
MIDQARFEAALERCPLVPVLVVDDASKAAPLAEALVDGGVTVAEVTLRTPAALDAISAMKQAAPELIMGAGTILTAADIDKAKAAGSEFLVSPGVSPELAAAMVSCGLIGLPGTATASEAMARAAEGFSMVKFFPAEQAGGAAYIKGLAGPLPKLKFMPTGGIKPDMVKSYLDLPNVSAVGGSWMATPQDMANDAWSAVSERIQAVLAGL